MCGKFVWFRDYRQFLCVSLLPPGCLFTGCLFVVTGFVCVPAPYGVFLPFKTPTLRTHMKRKSVRAEHTRAHILLETRFPQLLV